mmetsp:Transcript_29483/g.67947  ORF Transcript_29483/g.67947 Transcript_29483/m.67947 type:complete len:210 (-) Transcript_29483:529-1158(-)
MLIPRKVEAAPWAAQRIAYGVRLEEPLLAPLSWELADAEAALQARQEGAMRLAASAAALSTPEALKPEAHCHISVAVEVSHILLAILAGQTVHCQVGEQRAVARESCPVVSSLGWVQEASSQHLAWETTAASLWSPPRVAVGSCPGAMCSCLLAKATRELASPRWCHCMQCLCGPGTPCLMEFQLQPSDHSQLLLVQWSFARASFVAGA